MAAGSQSYESWDEVRSDFALVAPDADKKIALTREDIKRWPRFIHDGESLAQLLANLNFYVMELGEIHAKTERMSNWTKEQFAAEKGIELARIVNAEKKSATYAAGAKYEKVQQFIGTMVEASALHLRVQNCRSSARDTTEAIRSRIGQLRGAIRSS